MNIWSIKSKALRAIVAWLLAGLAAIVVLVALVPALVIIAVSATIGLVRLHLPLWRDEVFAPWWRAATGKEAV